MFTSDKGAGKTGYNAIIGAYLIATVFCALFGAVYELFSHGVYAFSMIYAFAFPLLLGAVPFFMRQRAGSPFPGYIRRNILHAGIAALTVGSVVEGVLEIYGTSNPLTSIYWIVGVSLTLVGWLAVILPAK